MKREVIISMVSEIIKHYNVKVSVASVNEGYQVVNNLCKAITAGQVKERKQQKGGVHIVNGFYTFVPKVRKQGNSPIEGESFENYNERLNLESC